MKKYLQPAFNILLAVWLAVTLVHSAVMIYGSYTDHTEVYPVGEKSCLIAVRSGDLAIACVDPMEDR